MTADKTPRTQEEINAALDEWERYRKQEEIENTERAERNARAYKRIRDEMVYGHGPGAWLRAMYWDSVEGGMFAFANHGLKHDR